MTIGNTCDCNMCIKVTYQIKKLNHYLLFFLLLQWLHRDKEGKVPKCQRSPNKINNFNNFFIGTHLCLIIKIMKKNYEGLSFALENTFTLKNLISLCAWFKSHCFPGSQGCLKCIGEHTEVDK